MAFAGPALAFAATFDRGKEGSGIPFFFSKPSFEARPREKGEFFREKRGEHGGKEAGRKGTREKTAGLEIEEGDPIVGQEAEIVSMQIGVENAPLGKVKDRVEEQLVGGRIEGSALGEGGGEKDGQLGAEGAAHGAFGEDLGDEDATRPGKGEIAGFTLGRRRTQGVAKAHPQEGKEVLLGKEDTLGSRNAEDAAEDAPYDLLGPGGNPPAKEQRMGVPHWARRLGAGGAPHGRASEGGARWA
jgi:hypothetical protein